jgi:GNAT superfamily N-acetyltransferase
VRADLPAILSLQKRWLKRNLSLEESRTEGFLTVEHTLDQLSSLHAHAPAIVALHGDELAGYALSMTLECADVVPDLLPMFQQFAALTYRGKRLTQIPFYVMGQICVAEEFRGEGVFQQLYAEHRRQYGSRFNALVTEVSIHNHRSMRAHKKLGFETIHHNVDSAGEWEVLLWPWF